MLKKIILAILCVCLLVVMCSCSNGTNSNVKDPYSTFGDGIYAKYAIVYFPDGSTVSGRLDHWTYYNHNPIIMMTIDGVKYITSAENVYFSSEVFE